MDGLYEVLALGSCVIKSNDHNTIIKEPGKKEVTIRDSDLAKFGTKAGRQTGLRCYAERRPKRPMGKTTEELIDRYAKNAKQKIEGDKKIKHKRINDDTSFVSSIHSNVLRALPVRMPNKPKKTVVPAPPMPPAETTSDFALPMTLSQTSIAIAEPPNRPKWKAAMRATTAIQPSQKRRRLSQSITEYDESMASTQTFPPNLSANTAPSRQKRRQILKQQQIQHKFIISTIKSTAARNQDTKQSIFAVGPCLHILRLSVPDSVLRLPQL